MYIDSGCFMLILSPKGPLINYSMSLRDLKRASARRNPQLMALVLNKGCNDAEVCFRPRPQGPSEEPHLRVGSLAFKLRNHSHYALFRIAK